MKRMQESSTQNKYPPMHESSEKRGKRRSGSSSRKAHGLPFQREKGDGSSKDRQRVACKERSSKGHVPCRDRFGASAPSLFEVLHGRGRVFLSAKFQNDPGQSHWGRCSDSGSTGCRWPNQPKGDNATNASTRKSGCPLGKSQISTRPPAGAAVRALGCGQSSLAVCLANRRRWERSEAGGGADANLSHGPDPRFFSSTAGTYGSACLPPGNSPKGQSAEMCLTRWARQLGTFKATAPQSPIA